MFAVVGDVFLLMHVCVVLCAGFPLPGLQLPALYIQAGRVQEGWAGSFINDLWLS